MKRLTKVKNKHKFKFKKLNKPLKWLDCVSQTGWLSVAQMEAAEPAVCKTGEFWIYKDTKDYITLFGTYSQDKDGTIEFGEVITIPKRWI
jgi:Fe-S-cluster containining protein